MNVIQTVNISTNIHNERINTKYIPLYIFENEGKIFKKLKKVKKQILPKLNEFPDFFLSVSTKTRTFASVNTCNGSV